MVSSSRHTGPPPVPRPAATVVLLRPGPGGRPEVLLTQRPATMAFAPDMHVFPGGALDPADRDPGLAARSARTPADAAAALGGNVEPAEAVALHLAALRELAEEAGVVLGDGVADGDGEVAVGWADRLRTDLLVPLAHWVTPRFMPRRFSTWFFAADLPPGMEPAFAADEVAAHRWITPEAALDRLADGELRMWAPTTNALQDLVAAGAGSAAELAETVVLGLEEPPRIVEEGADVVRIRVGAAGARPGRVGTTTLHGRRDLVVVDPGDPSEAALGAIEAAAARRGGTIRAVVLTSAEPARAAGAEALAIPLELPILAAPDAGRHLPYETRPLADGERLPADADVRVRLGPPGSGALEVVSASGA